jgi:hypothetical protein
MAIPETMMNSRKAKMTGIAGVVVLGALVFTISRTRLPSKPPRFPNDGAAMAPGRGFVVPPEFPRWPTTATATRATDAEPGHPIIDEIKVDKTEVCIGEEDFVTVRAHTPDGSDAFLNTQILDPVSRRYVSGNRVPFRLEEQASDDIKVIVSGKSGAAIAALPPVKVKDCVAVRQVVLEVRQPAASMERPLFKARVIEHPPESGRFDSLEPISYDWDFGDGHTQTTNASETEHSYEARDQGVAYSSFLVTVTVKDAAGNEARGSRALSFANTGFMTLMFQNQIAIRAGVKEAGKPGGVLAGEHEQIWLYHGYSKPVHIEEATLRETVLDTDGRERETFQRSYSPDALIGFHDLKPRESRSVRDLTDLQPSGANKTAVRFVELRGHSEDGKSANGKFTLLPAAEFADSEPSQVRPTKERTP